MVGTAAAGAGATGATGSAGSAGSAGGGLACRASAMAAAISRASPRAQAAWNAAPPSECRAASTEACSRSRSGPGTGAPMLARSAAAAPNSAAARSGLPSAASTWAISARLSATDRSSPAVSASSRLRRW